jgi:hypothetical protein
MPEQNRPTSIEMPFTTEEAASYLGFSVAYLKKMRCKKTGPSYIRTGHRSVWYAKADLERYLERRQKRKSL